MARTLGDLRRMRRAQDRFLRANESLAQAFAAKFLHGKRYDYEMCEAFSACMRGMYSASLSFDIQRGFAFSTYARAWMLKKLLEYEHTITNHVSRPILASMAKSARKIGEHDEQEDQEFLSLRACRHWHLFSVQLHASDPHAMQHGGQAKMRVSDLKDLQGEEEQEADYDGPQVLRYLKDALGERDFEILLALYKDGVGEEKFAERHNIPLPYVRQVRETAFNHARAFVR